MEYKNKGIIFIFKGNGIASKRSVVKDTCLLDEIVITSPNYCIDNICLGTSKSAIERRLGNGTYGIRNGVTDSTKLYYPKSGLTLTFDNGKKSGKLIKIGRSETRAYFLYRQKQAYKKMGNIR